MLARKKRILSGDKLCPIFNHWGFFCSGAYEGCLDSSREKEWKAGFSNDQTRFSQSLQIPLIVSALVNRLLDSLSLAQLWPFWLYPYDPLTLTTKARNCCSLCWWGKYVLRKTSQELRMLSRSLSDCKLLLLNVMIQVLQFVSNSQLCH